MPPFFTATNILLIKSNIKFEPRVTTVSVAVSPRYLGGKYRSRLHPRSRKCACRFWGRLEKTWNRNCARSASSASRGDSEIGHAVFKSWISYAHCPFQWTWQVLHNYDISVLQQVGMFLNGMACLMRVWLLIKREFPRVLMTWRDARARILNVTSQM